MSNLKLIMQREFIARVRNKTFVVMTFLSPIIFTGMIGLIAWLTSINNNDGKTIVIVDETGTLASELSDTDNTTYLNYTQFGLESAKDSVVAKDYYGLLYIPEAISNANIIEGIQFYADESPNLSLIRSIERKIANKLTSQNYKKEGLDLSIIENSKAEVSIEIENFSGEKTSKMANYVKMFFGGAAGYLLMMFIIIYGNMVMRSVIEEKTNRIIEIIISSVKPMQLMMGKILGTSLAGILQFVIWVVLGGVLLTVAISVFNLEPQTPGLENAQELSAKDSSELQLILNDILKLPLGSLVMAFFIYFIGGYFLYSSIYAAIGAAVDSETDSQQFMFPIILPLILGIYVGFFAVVENPHGTISTIFSFIPLTSSIVMLMRIPFGVPWWELVLSIIILIGSIIFMIWFAGRIYRIGILMYGKKPTYKDLYRWLKY